MKAKGFNTGDICHSKTYKNFGIFYTLNESDIMQFFNNEYDWEITNSGIIDAYDPSWSTYKIISKCKSKLVKVMYD